MRRPQHNQHISGYARKQLHWLWWDITAEWNGSAENLLSHLHVHWQYQPLIMRRVFVYCCGLDINIAAALTSSYDWTLAVYIYVTEYYDVRDSSFVARAHSIVLQSLAHISSTAQYICSIFVSYPIDSFWDSAQCSSTQYNMQEWHCIIVSQLKITSINCYFLLPKLKWKKKTIASWFSMITNIHVRRAYMERHRQRTQI